MVIAGLFILETNCPQSRTAEVNYGALFDRLLGGHLSDGASAPFALPVQALGSFSL